jgi:cytochrome b561
MAAQYLVTCILLAVTLNAANRHARAAGTLLAALALFMISISIVLADFDGTFAQYAPHGLIDRSKPIVLNLQAGLGLLATGFLLWAAWAQLGRRAVAPLPARNTRSLFGSVSRLAHWTTATLMLLLIPMGLFLSVLPATGGDRASFLAAHQTLGLIVLLVVAIRLAWLLISPPPRHEDLPDWQRRLAVAVHCGLYALILAFPLSGFLLSAAAGDPIHVFGWTLPRLAVGERAPWSALHDSILPLVFYAIVAMHVGAVLKHHFADRRQGDVRRMLR